MERTSTGAWSAQEIMRVLGDVLALLFGQPVVIHIKQSFRITQKWL